MPAQLTLGKMMWKATVVKIGECKQHGQVENPKCLRGCLPKTDLAEEGNDHQSSAGHAKEDGSHQLD